MIQFYVYDNMGRPLSTARPVVDRYTLAGPLPSLECTPLGEGLFEFDPVVDCMYQVSTGATPPYYIGLSPYDALGPQQTSRAYLTTLPPDPGTP